MKKVCIIAVALTVVAGIASADFAIDWKNVAQPVNIDGSTPLLDGALLQLIWVADTSGDRSVSKAGVGGATAPGELLLAEGATLSPAGPPPNFGLWVEGIKVITVAGVNTGYVFTRIFQDGSADAGDMYWDSPLLSAAKEYNPLDTGSIEVSNTITGPSSISEFGTTVIPEPATIGLMGIAGLGMFLARKKTRR